MKHDMESCDKVVKIKTTLGLRPVASVKGKSEALKAMYRVMVKLEQDLTLMDRCNSDEKVMVKIDGSSSHMMI